MRGRGLGRGSIARVRSADGWAYQARWQDASGNRRRRIVASDKRTAERVLADIIRQRDLELAGLGGEVAQEIPIERLRAEYLADLRTRCSPGHVERTQECLSLVLGSLSALRVRDIQPEEVLRYRRHRVTQGVSNATVNKEVGCLRTMLRWATRNALAASNPLEGLTPLPAKQRRHRRALGDDEVDRLIETSRLLDEVHARRQSAGATIEGGTKGASFALKDRPPRIPQTPLWLALLELGLRWGEASSLTWADLDEEARSLTVLPEVAKNRRARVLPLKEGLLRELSGLRLLQGRLYGRAPEPAERLFLSPRGLPWRERRNALAMLRRLLAEAQIPETDAQGRKVDLHALRHTFASRLARAGVELQHAQRLMGHSDPRLTVQVYTHLETEDLRTAISRMPEAGETSRKARERGRKMPLEPEPREGGQRGARLTPSPASRRDGARGRIRTGNPRFTKAVHYRCATLARERPASGDPEGRLFRCGATV